MEYATSLKTANREEAEAYLLQDRECISIDIETINLDNTLPVGIAVAVDRDIGYYFFDTGSSLLHKLISRTPTIILHNAAFDLPILKRIGHTVRNFEDTMLLAYSAGVLENSLESLSLSVLGKDYVPVTSLWDGQKGNIGINHLSLATISIRHALNTLGLWYTLPKLPLYYEIDKPCVSLVLAMEKHGLLINQTMTTEVEQETVVIVEGLEKELRRELGDEINLSSNPQIVTAFQSKGIIGTKKTKAGKYSVSDESLRPLHHPLADKLLEWRSEMKTLTTYIPFFRSVDYEGRIHTHFGYTSTGRWNSSRPNLQNITNPKPNHKYSLRGCIRATTNYKLLSLDASQLELRVAAIVTQDPIMLTDLKAKDLHLATAIQVFGYTDDPVEMKHRRYLAKTANFAVLYGADEYKLAEMTGMSLSEAGEFLTEYFNKYRVLKQWIDALRVQARRDGFVTSMFGRIRPIPDLTSGSWKLREAAEREAINMPIQSTAVDIVKKMMLYLDNILHPDVRLVLQVHDEVIYETPNKLVIESIHKIRELYIAFPDYPVAIKYGDNYNNMKEVK